jgi:hypothetical protein
MRMNIRLMIQGNFSSEGLRGARMMPMLAMVAVLLSAPVSAQAFAPEERTLAAQYFAEFTRFCADVDRKLWPPSMCGHTMLVKPASRSVMATHLDPDGTFQGVEGFYVGSLPSTLSIANTSLRWTGTRWTQMMWPLPEDKRARLALFAHEAWHGIQAELGLPSTGPSNGHLDEEQARVLMRLEWRALAEALRASNAVARERAVRDALAFRAQRHAAFTQAQADESALELHEGLAEYTGIALAYGADAPAHAAQQLARGEKMAMLSRSFAYFSGPAYGLLLDTLAVGWRNNVVRAGDLAKQLSRALEPGALSNPGEATFARYDGNGIAAEERDRAEATRARSADIKQRFIDGPVLRLPLKNMNFEMNPQAIFNLSSEAQFHETIKVSDDWGELRALKGALITQWQSLAVVAPRAIDALENEHWTLKLKPSWRLKADGASYTVVRD